MGIPDCTNLIEHRVQLHGETPAQFLEPLPRFNAERPRRVWRFRHQPRDGCLQSMLINEELMPEMARLGPTGWHKHTAVSRHVLVHRRGIGRHYHRPTGHGLHDVVAPAFRA